jgi:hypothetical protein
MEHRLRNSKTVLVHPGREILVQRRLGLLEQKRVDRRVGISKTVSTIVGPPDAAVNESRERVRSALRNSGLIFRMSADTCGSMDSFSASTGAAVVVRSVGEH